ncbi:MAG: UDP-3-O-(3-hydroxymyristoyl)glucosamine N-acyltransferase [Pyrinomonadaceae bacterium]
MKISEIVEFVGGKLYGDGEIEIGSAASIGDAKTGQIAFFEQSSDMPATDASCVIVPTGFAAPEAETRPVGSACLVFVDNPKLAFARITAILHPQKARDPEIHPSAVISPTAQIGADLFIGAFTCVGDNSKIGDGTQLMVGAKVGDKVSIGNNCVLYPNVFIEDGCIVGNGVVLHAGVVIGSDGFGYVKDNLNNYIKFPQIGSVVIEDDVEIGANSCVDRGALGVTRIGEGTKIDNLVQVGHNVDIGKRCVIAAQTGISGSVVIEDDCVIGGQVGFGDHVRVQSGAVIGSQAGVLPGKIVRPGVWWGTPIQPLDEYKKQNAHVKSLARLKEEIKEMKRQIDALMDSK